MTGIRLYPSRSLTAGSGHSDTAGANGVELTSTAVIPTGAQPTPRRRQVILVTHNANLVINTDADQIILAEVGAASAGGLPPIRYQSGGLNEMAIRTLVCNILEGGELAFKDRARRLRIGLKR